MINPSLREEPRQQKAPIIESRVDSSIISWLEGTGRLMERDIVSDGSVTNEEIDDELSTSLIGSDDIDYDDDFEEESED
jgi:hypothetical protein